MQVTTEKAKHIIIFSLFVMYSSPPSLSVFENITQKISTAAQWKENFSNCFICFACDPNGYIMIVFHGLALKLITQFQKVLLF